MATLLPITQRSGVLTRTVTIIAGSVNTALLSLPIDTVDLVTRPSPTAVSIVLDQSGDGGVTWSILAACTTWDLHVLLASLRRDGSPRTTMDLSVTEQVYRSDIVAARGWAKTHTASIAGESYDKLALLEQLRLTIDVFRPDPTTHARLGNRTIRYGVDVTTENRDWTGAL
jgi:hypothetical protein